MQQAKRELLYTLDDFGGELPNVSKYSKNRDEWLTVAELTEMSNDFCGVSKMRKLVNLGVFGKILQTFNAMYVKKIPAEQVQKMLLNLVNEEK